MGVDRLAGNWRVWNWPVHQSVHLQHMLTLDPLCQHGSVYADNAAAWFWLGEELPSGVRVARRDATSLAVIDDAVWLPGVRLLETQRDLRPLNGYHQKGIVLWDSKLLLLREDDQGELVLYQI